MTHFIDPVHGIDLPIEEIAALQGIALDKKRAQHHIDDCSWGKTLSTFKDRQTLTGKQGQRGDVVLLPDRDVIPWDWAWQAKEGGLAMNHDGMSGGRLLNEEDIRHYIVEPCQGNLPSILILTLGRGFRDLENEPGVLRVPSSLPAEIEKNFGVKKVLVLKTQKAIPKYNELVAKGIAVAAMIHTTC